MNRSLAKVSFFFLSKNIFSSIYKFKFLNFYLCAFALMSCYFSPISLFAQELFLTAKYDKNGITDLNFTSEEWKIDAIEGSFVYILFRNETEITDHKLYLFVDRKINSETKPSSNEQFEEYDNKKIYINKKRNWAAIQYTFLQAGIYKVSIANANKEIITSKEITVHYKSKILFSNDLNGHKYPISHQKNFELEEAKKGVYVFIKDEIPFASPSLKVVIEKQNSEGNYQKYAEEIFFIDEKLRFSFFNQTFELKGTYRISVFKENEDILAVGFLQVV